MLKSAFVNVTGGSDLGGKMFTELIFYKCLLCADLELPPPAKPPTIVLISPMCPPPLLSSLFSCSGVGCACS